MGYTVYKHTFPNGKVYIGMTSINPNARWNNGNGYKGKLISKAISEFGWDNVKHDVLYSELTEENAKQIEILLINKYKSNDKRFGYNTTKGGEVVSDNTKKKISESVSGKNNHNYGKTLSKEYKEKISKTKKGSSHTKETKKKISESMSKRIGRSIKCIETNKIYDTATQANKETNIDRSSITAVCRGRQKTAGGYHWKYMN